MWWTPVCSVCAAIYWTHTAKPWFCLLKLLMRFNKTIILACNLNTTNVYIYCVTFVQKIFTWQHSRERSEDTVMYFPKSSHKTGCQNAAIPFSCYSVQCYTCISSVPLCCDISLTEHHWLSVVHVFSVSHVPLKLLAMIVVRSIALFCNWLSSLVLDNRFQIIASLLLAFCILKFVLRE